MKLLYISILWLEVCVDSISADVHVTAKVGSSALLPCNLSNKFTQLPHIQWRTSKKIVFERSSSGTSEGSGYEGRVDVPEDKLFKGNCSLVLKDVRTTDDGAYSVSAVNHGDRANPYSWKEVVRVKLSVEPPEKHEDKTSTVSGGAGMNSPRLLILIISLLVFLLFYVEDVR